MPLYEYQCTTCSKVTEIIQKFSDTPLAECPECQGPLTKLMSMNSFALKGGGWYTSDYKRSSSSSSASTAPACGTGACGASSAGGCDS